jgi:two-component system, OmpR family, response regulator ResD
MARILTADDQQEIRDAIKMALSEEHDVTPVESGEKALEALESEDFDCILLDVMMPGIGGIAALREIVEHHSDTPVACSPLPKTFGSP